MTTVPFTTGQTLDDTAREQRLTADLGLVRRRDLEDDPLPSHSSPDAATVTMSTTDIG